MNHLTKPMSFIKATSLRNNLILDLDPKITLVTDFMVLNVCDNSYVVAYEGHLNAIELLIIQVYIKGFMAGWNSNY